MEFVREGGSGREGTTHRVLAVSWGTSVCFKTPSKGNGSATSSTIANFATKHRSKTGGQRLGTSHGEERKRHSALGQACTDIGNLGEPEVKKRGREKRTESSSI